MACLAAAEDRSRLRRTAFLRLGLRVKHQQVRQCSIASRHVSTVHAAQNSAGIQRCTVTRAATHGVRPDATMPCMAKHREECYRTTQALNELEWGSYRKGVGGMKGAERFRSTQQIWSLAGPRHELPVGQHVETPARVHSVDRIGPACDTTHALNAANV